MSRMMRRILYMAVVVMAVSTITFVMLDLLPVSIAHQIAGVGATSGDIEAIRRQLGLDAPVLHRYGTWVAGVLRGNLGNSLYSGLPVTKAIAGSLPVTVELLVLSQILALALAVPTGIACAWRTGSGFDRFCGAAGFALSSIPPYALAIVLIFIFSVRLKWFPATGHIPLAGGLFPNMRSFVLPAVSIALTEWVILMRVLRSDMKETLGENYILLARAKGLPTWRILLGHALRPSCFSLLTLLGLHAGNLIGGAVIIETIFALPGIGRLLVSGIFAQDYTMVEGCVLVIAVGYVLINFLVDASYALLDPRIRREAADG